MHPARCCRWFGRRGVGPPYRRVLRPERRPPIGHEEIASCVTDQLPRPVRNVSFELVARRSPRRAEAHILARQPRNRLLRRYSTRPSETDRMDSLTWFEPALISYRVDFRPAFIGKAVKRMFIKSS